MEGDRMTVTTLTMSPVQCLSWCTDGAGHLDAEEPEEQHCHSAPRRIDLGPPRAQVGGRSPGHVVVHLYRDVSHAHGSPRLRFEPPHLEVYASGSEVLRLSVLEARAVAAVLVDLCDAAEA
jgi:hypothetical protein